MTFQKNVFFLAYDISKKKRCYWRMTFQTQFFLSSDISNTNVFLGVLHSKNRLFLSIIALPGPSFLLSLQFLSYSLDSSPVSSLQRPFFPDTFKEIGYKGARSIGIVKGFLTLVSKSHLELSFNIYNVFTSLISRPRSFIENRCPCSTHPNAIAYIKYKSNL